MEKGGEQVQQASTNHANVELEQQIGGFRVISFDAKNQPISSVIKRTISVREIWGLIPGPVKSAQCGQRLA